MSLRKDQGVSRYPTEPKARYGRPSDTQLPRDIRRSLTLSR
jgi:hypothetical protein